MPAVAASAAFPVRVQSKSAGGPESGSPIHVPDLGPVRAGSRIITGSRIRPKSGSRIRVPDLGPVPARVPDSFRVVPNPGLGSGSRIWAPSRPGSRIHSGWSQIRVSDPGPGSGPHPGPGPGFIPGGAKSGPGSGRRAGKSFRIWLFAGPGGPKSGSRIRVPDLGPVPGHLGPVPAPASTLAGKTLQVAYLRLLRHETGCAGRTCKPEIFEPQQFLPALPHCAAHNVSRTTTNCCGSLLCGALCMSIRAPFAAASKLAGPVLASAATTCGQM